MSSNKRLNGPGWAAYFIADVSASVVGFSKVVFPSFWYTVSRYVSVVQFRPRM